MIKRRVIGAEEGLLSVDSEKRSQGAGGERKRLKGASTRCTVWEGESQKRGEKKSDVTQLSRLGQSIYEKGRSGEGSPETSRRRRGGGGFYGHHMSEKGVVPEQYSRRKAIRESRRRLKRIGKKENPS